MRAGEGDYRPVGNRTLWLSELDIPDDLWASFQIPIGLAFFFYNSLDKKLTAFYPGPAGATESELPLDEWQTMIAGDPILATLAPDVEAILMRKHEGATSVYLIPVDAAYELVGLIRTGWRGFDGGVDVKAKIDAYFARIESRT